MCHVGKLEKHMLSKELFLEEETWEQLEEWHTSSGVGAGFTKPLKSSEKVIQLTCVCVSVWCRRNRKVKAEGLTKNWLSYFRDKMVGAWLRLQQWERMRQFQKHYRGIHLVGWRKGQGAMLHHLMTAMPHAENDVHSRNSSRAETWPHTGHGKINENANETSSALIHAKQYCGTMTLRWLFFSQSE